MMKKTIKKNFFQANVSQTNISPHVFPSKFRIHSHYRQNLPKDILNKEISVRKLLLSWKKIIYQIQFRPRKNNNKLRVKKIIKIVSPYASKKIGIYLLVSFGIIGMLFWNPILLIATSTGVLIMLLVYSLLRKNWQIIWSNWQRFFSGDNIKFTIAVVSGGFAALMSYIAASIWVESKNPWLATGSILQGIGTLITLGILLWQVFITRINQQQTKYSDLLTDLCDSKSLKRLIAVRNLTKMAINSGLSTNDRQELLEYFQLMLTVEPVPKIQEALLNSLILLEKKKVIGKNERKKSIPITLKRINHPVKEYS